MTNRSAEFLRRLGVAQPIFQAPMGGSGSTPELAAAVSEAGGMGNLGCAYMTPAEIADAIRRTRALTARPFGVNLFSGGDERERQVDPSFMLGLLGEIHAALELPPPALPTLPPDPFAAQLAAVLEARPPFFSFTFGMPDAAQLAALRTRGILVAGTATTLAEARLLAEAGVDAIVAQGAEAGAHRGSFAAPFAAAMVPTLRLVEEIAAAVAVPVIASGGLMDGADVAMALGRGAAAAGLGTAYLATPEAGAPAAHKQALLAQRRDDTVITRAFSGRPARGIRNEFIRRLAGREDSILPFPLQNALTRAMRNAAGKRGVSEYLSLWAGTGVARCRDLPAAELTRRLAAEAAAAAPPDPPG